jgi:hypothetical protein
MQTWLRKLSLRITARRQKGLAPFPDNKYIFLVDGYYRRNPFRAAIRVSEGKDGNEFEVLQIVSRVPSMKAGTVEFGGGYCTWHTPSFSGDGEWPIRFRKR